MAITLVGYQTVVVTSSSTPINIPVPNGVQAGDLLLVHLALYNVQFSIPAGWRLLTLTASRNSSAQWDPNRILLAYRVADGSEAASYSFGSGSAALGGMTAWRGVDTNRPFEDWAVVGSVGSQSSLTFPSCGMGGSDRVVLRCYSQTGTTPATVTWGSGISEIYNVSDATYGRAILAQETSANASERTVSLSAARRTCGVTLVLLPAGATPAPATGYRGSNLRVNLSLSTFTVDVPQAYPGDVIVLAAAHPASATATTPGGFALLGSGTVGTTTVDVWGRAAGASEPAQVTVTFPSSTSATVTVHVFRGFPVVRAIDGVGAAGANSITLPAVAVSDPAVIDLRIVGQSSTLDPTPPSGFAPVIYAYGLGNRPHLVFYRPLENATTTGTAAVTYTGAQDLYGFTIVLAPAGAGVELAGSAAGSAAALGQLQVARRLAGTAAGAAYATGFLQRIVGLAGRAGGTASARADLVRDVLLAGRADGLALARGLVGIGRELAGTAVGGGWTWADLSVLMQVLLAGRAVGTSGAGAALLVERLLAGRGSGAAAAGGALVVGRLLAGRGVGEARATATIRVPAILVGRAVGVGAARGSIAAPILFAGQAVGAAIAWAPTALDLDMTETHLRTVWATTRPWVAVEGETETDGIVGTVVLPAELLIDPVGTGTVVVARVGLRPLVPSSTPFAVGVESALAALEPGDVVPVVLPLEAGGGAVGLCRVLAIDEDPDRGEVRLQVQFIGQLEADDAAAYQDVGRPRVATDRATNLGRVVRELRRR